MSMDLIKVGDNGQLEFDFESLEAITSAEFVADIKSKIATGYSIIKSQLYVDEHTVGLMLLTAYKEFDTGAYAYSCTYHKGNYPFYMISKCTVGEVYRLQEFIDS